MFEGNTTITFSKEAARLMLSENVSRMFNMTLDVTSYEDDYNGLTVTFGRPELEKTVDEDIPVSIDDEGNIVEANPVEDDMTATTQDKLEEKS